MKSLAVSGWGCDFCSEEIGWWMGKVRKMPLLEAWHAEDTISCASHEAKNDLSC